MTPPDAPQLSGDCLSRRLGCSGGSLDGSLNGSLGGSLGGVLSCSTRRVTSWVAGRPVGTWNSIVHLVTLARIAGTVLPSEELIEAERVYFDA